MYDFFPFFFLSLFSIVLNERTTIARQYISSKCNNYTYRNAHVFRHAVFRLLISPYHLRLSVVRYTYNMYVCLKHAAALFESCADRWTEAWNNTLYKQCEQYSRLIHVCVTTDGRIPRAVRLSVTILEVRPVLCVRALHILYETYCFLQPPPPPRLLPNVVIHLTNVKHTNNRVLINNLQIECQINDKLSEIAI